MTNVLEGMKAVYDEKVWEVCSIKYNYPETLFSLFYYPSPEEKYRGYPKDNVPEKLVKPLLRFPDKDSQGSECWSGDLFQLTTGNSFVIFFNGLTWKSVFIWKGDMDIDFLSDIRDWKHLLANYNLIRTCSLFDPEALDYLDQETITKLKEMVRWRA